MRLFRVMAPVLLAIAMVAGMASVTAAQDAPEATPEAGLPDGLERWYARAFSADLLAMIDTGTPEATPSGWFLMSANVLEFESEEQAAAGIDVLLEQFEAEMTADGVELEEVQLDLELDHTAMRAQQEENGVTTVVMEAIAQDGEYVYAVIGITLGVDPAPLTEMAIQVMAEGDASGEETYNVEGASEGGLWAKLPAAEEIMAQEPGLVTVQDAVFYPAPQLEATPAP